MMKAELSFYWSICDSLCLNVFVFLSVYFVYCWWVLTEELPGSSIKHLEQQQTKATAYHRRKQNHEAINSSLLCAGSNLRQWNKDFENHFVNKEDTNRVDKKLTAAFDKFCFDFFSLQNQIKPILLLLSNVSCWAEDFEWRAAAMRYLKHNQCNLLWMWFGFRFIVNGAWNIQWLECGQTWQLPALALQSAHRKWLLCRASGRHTALQLHSYCTQTCQQSTVKRGKQNANDYKIHI